ncbi:MAG: hypothetical protein H6759_03630 [Candidatus Nomurabacteria bacterium]|nr:MAG: hypothetical protein H6759_03630 [Candidatus Nomurabacteria bacterium]
MGGDERDAIGPVTIEKFENSLCAFKSWDLNYQNNSKAGFNAFNEGLSLDFIRKYPLSSDDTCTNSSAPWFTVRAVFQSPQAKDPVTGNIINNGEPDGTWTFVGFGPLRAPVNLVAITATCI